MILSDSICEIMQHFLHGGEGSASESAQQNSSECMRVTRVVIDMRSLRRILPLCLICASVITYSMIALRLRSADVSATKDSWFMDYRVLFEPTISDEDRSILIMVATAPGHFHKRDVVRKTWGSSPGVRVLYLLGVPANYTEEQRKRIEHEVHSYRDIVQLDFVDVYRNLTLKTCGLVMWTVRNTWPKRKIVIKADDDTCINMPLLTQILDDFKDGLYGEYWEAAKPYRCKPSSCGKWGLTFEEYNASTLPPFVQGSFYVIAESALKKLHDELFVPQFLPLEDVYLTGMVARAANVSVQPMPKKTFINPETAKSDWRNSNGLVAQHRCEDNMQVEFWKRSLRKTTPPVSQ